MVTMMQTTKRKQRFLSKKSARDKIKKKKITLTHRKYLNVKGSIIHVTKRQICTYWINICLFKAEITVKKLPQIAQNLTL